MPDGPAGGTVTVLRALAALAELDGDEEYVFVGPYEDPEWLRPLLPPGQKVVRGPQAMSSVEWKVDSLEPFKRTIGPLRPLAREVRRMLTSTSARVVSPESDSPRFAAAARGSFFQRLGCDVVHFPFQTFESCGLPSIFNPHDLQHLHLPEFFTAKELSDRGRFYPAACRAAHTVVVASQFVKHDLVERFGVESQKVQVIPWAPPPLPKLLKETDDREVRAVRQKYELGDGPFALYPANTWEHKNHLRLLEAVALLRAQHGLNLRVVCTGFRTDFWAIIEVKLNESGLTDVVKFPGLVPIDDLNTLYRASQFVFVPTLFEAASAPVFEAWQHGVPVSCSRVTSLSEQVADAALLFDPLSVNEIAASLQRLTADFNLREDLRKRGTRRLKDFSLERTAKAYRAVYRRAAGQSLAEEDRWLLGADQAHQFGSEIEAMQR